MNAYEMVQYVHDKKAAGKEVEIMTAFHDGMDPIGSIEALSDDWVEYRARGLPETYHAVPIAQVKGLRALPGDGD